MATQPARKSKQRNNALDRAISGAGEVLTSILSPSVARENAKRDEDLRRRQEAQLRAQNQPVQPPQVQAPQETTTKEGNLQIFEEAGSRKIDPITGEEIQGTGRGSGVVLPDGRVFFGLNPKEVARIKQDIEGEQVNPQIPTAQTDGQVAQNAQAFQEQAAILQQNKALLPTVGQTQQLPLGQLPTLDPTQVLGSGGLAASPALAGLGLRGTGALAAGGAAGIAGAPVVGGLISAGLINSLAGNLRQQLKEDLAAESGQLPDLKRSLSGWINLVNANPANADEYLAAFNMQLSLIDRAHGRAILQVQRTPNRLLGVDGTVELQEFDNFNSVGGQRQLLIQRMREALLTPDPNKIINPLEFGAGLN